MTPSGRMGATTDGSVTHAREPARNQGFNLGGPGGLLAGLTEQELKTRLKVEEPNSVHCPLLSGDKPRFIDPPPTGDGG